MLRLRQRFIMSLSLLIPSCVAFIVRRGGGAIRREVSSSSCCSSSTIPRWRKQSRSPLLSPRVLDSHSTRLFSSSAVPTIDTSEPDQDNDFFATNTTFEDLGIQSQILRQRIPFALPTKVQAAAIERILQGGDITIGAETGSGKVRLFLDSTRHFTCGSPNEIHRRWPIYCRSWIAFL